MALLEGKTPAERNKTIAAIALGAIAFISLSYMLFGGSSAPAKKPASNANSSRATASPTPRSAPIGGVVGNEGEMPGIEFLRRVDYDNSPPPVPEAGRNIFAFYEAPPPRDNSNSTNAAPAPTQVPTPTPVPPNLLLASVSPINVYARTGDFTLEVTGDKFTPAVHIELNGTQLPTRFINGQQLSTTVPASLISFGGPRTISVRSADGQLFSNTATLNVQDPPAPNYIFVGLLVKRGSNDTALLKDKTSRELLSVQRGDLIGGRFRVASISEREVSLVDANLKIKHSLALTTDAGGSATAPPTAPTSGFPNPNRQYTPPPQGDDDEEP